MISEVVNWSVPRSNCWKGSFTRRNNSTVSWTPHSFRKACTALTTVGAARWPGPQSVCTVGQEADQVPSLP